MPFERLTAIFSRCTPSTAKTGVSILANPQLKAYAEQQQQPVQAKLSPAETACNEKMAALAANKNELIEYALCAKGLQHVASQYPCKALPSKESKPLTSFQHYKQLSQGTQFKKNKLAELNKRQVDLAKRRDQASDKLKALGTTPAPADQHQALMALCASPPSSPQHIKAELARIKSETELVLKAGRLGAFDQETTNKKLAWLDTQCSYLERKQIGDAALMACKMKPDQLRKQKLVPSFSKEHMAICAQHTSAMEKWLAGAPPV